MPQVGDRIKHAKRGEGLVAEILPDGRARVVFDDEAHGEHRYNPSSHSKLSQLKEGGGPSSSSSGAAAASSSADGAGVGVGGVGASGVVDGPIDNAPEDQPPAALDC